LRKALSFGTGCAVVIQDDALEITITRVRPGGARIIATTRIEGFRELPAAEWGIEYGKFLSRHNGRHLAAYAILPRNEVIVRQISLPGVDDKDVANAIRYQLDSLHPYGEDDIYADWKRLGATPHFLIGIAEKTVVDRYTALFTEAGIKLAGFTLSAAAVYAAHRLLQQPRAGGFLAVHHLEAGPASEVELYGESPAKPVFSALFDMPAERAIGLALSELRLSSENPPVDLADVLPPLSGAPSDYDFSRAGRSRSALSYAASLAAACPHLGATVNLLPAELRVSTSRLHYVPTAVLSVILLLMGVGLALQGSWHDRRYSELIQAEMRKLEPAARKIEKLDQQTQQVSARINALAEFRSRTRSDLEVLQELTRILAPPAWVNGMDINRTTVQLSGEAEQAEGLLRVLDSSPLLQNSEFMMPITRGGAGETFRIRSQREVRR